MTKRSVLFLFGFALAAMFWPGQAGAAEPSRWAYIAVAVPVGLFFTRIRPSPTHWLIAAFLAWAAVTMLWADVYYDAASMLYHFVLMAGIFAICFEIEDPTWLYRGIGAGLGISTIICLIQKAGYDPVIAVLPAGSGQNPSGLFINPSLLGEATAPFVILMAARREWLWAGLVLPCLVLAENRAGMIAFGICSLILAWQLRNKWVWAGLGLLYIPALYLVVTKGLHPWDSIPQRLAMWQGVWNGFSWLGHGVGQYYADFPLYSQALDAQPSPVFVLTAHAHNDLLEVFFEMGVPGVILMAGVCWTVWRRAPFPEAIALAAMAITSLVGFPLREPFTAALAAIMAGIAVSPWRVVGRNQFHRGPGLHHRFQPFNSDRSQTGIRPVPV